MNQKTSNTKHLFANSAALGWGKEPTPAKVNVNQKPRKGILLIAAAAMALPVSVAHAAVIVDYEFVTASPSATVGSSISSISFTGGPSVGGYTNWVTGTEMGTQLITFNGASGTGRTIDISLNATGYENISLGSFFQLSANNTIAAVNWQLSYSTDGGSNFTQIGTDFAVINVGAGNSENSRILTGANFALPSAADDNPDVVFRINSAPDSLTFDGGTPAGGQVRFDNFTINADAIPEPSAALLGALGVLGLLRRRRV